MSPYAFRQNLLCVPGIKGQSPAAYIRQRQYDTKQSRKLTNFLLLPSVDPARMYQLGPKNIRTFFFLILDGQNFFKKELLSVLLPE